MEPNSKFPDIALILSMRPDIESSYLLKCIEYSVKSNTYKILKDQGGTACGYIIWANVNRETIHKIVRVSAYPSFLYEWSEGGITLLIDMYNKWENSTFVTSQIRDTIYEKRILFYKKRKEITLKIRKKNIFYSFPENRIKKSF